MELSSILIEAGIKIAVIVNVILVMASVEVYIERKVSAWIQNRVGPNRVGPFGMLQPIADVVKLFMKEDLVPIAANKPFHRLAPFLTLVIAIAVYAVIPYSSYISEDINVLGLFIIPIDEPIYLGIAPNINIGLLFILAMTSVSVYGITLAGWSSNSKYSLFGGLRSAAQMISYELAMGLSVIAVVIMTGEVEGFSRLSINGIIMDQGGWFYNWNFALAPVACIIFIITAFAETNRTPFDLPEAEPELVGGFNTEYSGMKFGMFFLAEYAAMALASAFIIILFFGGWQTGIAQSILDSIGASQGTLFLAFLQLLAFMSKLMFFIFFFVWVRWSVPRFRYDQLMYLGWKTMLPLSIVNVMVMSFEYFYEITGLTWGVLIITLIIMQMNYKNKGNKKRVVAS